MNKATCPSCGYTKKDAQIHGDHNLCKNAGNAPWEKGRVAPSRSAAPKLLTPLDVAKKIANIGGIDRWAKILEEWLDSYIDHWKKEEKLWKEASAAPPSEREAFEKAELDIYVRQGYVGGFDIWKAARAAVPQAAAFVQEIAGYYRLASDMHETAERIIKRVVTNVLSIAHTRNDLGDLADSDPIDEQEFIADGLGLALGEDTGCLDPDDLSAENCEVLFVEKELREFVARAAAVPAPGAECKNCHRPLSEHTHVCPNPHCLMCKTYFESVAGATAPPKEAE